MHAFVANVFIYIFHAVPSTESFVIQKDWWVWITPECFSRRLRRISRFVCMRPHVRGDADDKTSSSLGFWIWAYRLNAEKSDTGLFYFVHILNIYMCYLLVSILTLDTFWPLTDQLPFTKNVMGGSVHRILKYYYAFMVEARTLGNSLALGTI